MKACNKHKIQNYVGHGGNAQIVQRPQTVPLSLHDGHTDVIENNGGHAAEVHPEVLQGVGQDFHRCPHQNQHFGNEQQTGSRCNQGREESKKEGVVNGLLGIGVVLCPEVPGNDYTAANADTVKETDDHKGQIAATADGSKGAVVGKIADDPGIRHIIELLQ